MKNTLGVTNYLGFFHKFHLWNL